MPSWIIRSQIIWTIRKIRLIGPPDELHRMGWPWWKMALTYIFTDKIVKPKGWNILGMDGMADTADSKPAA